jgi:hypothetical protein
MKRIRTTIESLRGNRVGISPSVDRFLDEHGDEQIIQFIISRNVISPLITGTLNVLSPNFKRKNNGNPLYHLKVLIKTEKMSLSLEKNERITISRYQMNKGAENVNVSIPSGLTLNILLSNAKLFMGGKFLSYSAYDNNCGDLVLAILKSNNLSTYQNISFTEQTTKNLFTPQLRKITNTVSDIAGKFDIIRQGGDIKKKNPWIEHVKSFAKDNEISYFKALSDPRCKSQYRKVIGDGVSSSRVTPEEDIDPNISMVTTNKIHRELKQRQIRENDKRELADYLAYERLTQSQKDNVDAKDLLRQNLRDQNLIKRIEAENRRQKSKERNKIK